jgi:hypothetical protein
MKKKGEHLTLQSKKSKEYTAVSRLENAHGMQVVTDKSNRETQVTNETRLLLNRVKTVTARTQPPPAHSHVGPQPFSIIF